MITFSRGEELFGYNATAFKKFMAYVANGLTPHKSTMDKLLIKSKKDYNKIVNILIDNGYIIKERSIVCLNGLESFSVPYTMTEKGRELSRAKCGNRMNRSQADKLFNEILERVKEVNDNPYYLYKINNIALFGSYITDKKDLGDIDIAFDYQFKRRIVKTKDGLDNETKANMKRSDERNCNDFVKSLSFGLHEVSTFLKKRSPKIHITPYSHLEYLNTEIKTINIQ